MPPSDLTIPFTDVYQNQFILSLYLLPQERAYTNNPAVYVSLSADRKVEDKFSITCIKFMAERLIEYMETFPDVILILYYDTADIKISKNRIAKGVNPQSYRFDLFNALIDRFFISGYTKSNLTIDDPENGGHYCTLLSKEQNSEEISNLDEVILNDSSK